MKLSRRILSAILTVSMVIAPTQRAIAEDIDLFVGGTTTADNPNVLIVMDNSDNWAAQSQHWPDGIFQGQAELRALKTVLNEVNDKLNMGLMMLTPGVGTTAGVQNKDGGFIRYAIRQMTAGNKAGLQEMIGDAGCVDGPNSVAAVPFGNIEPRNCIFRNATSGPLKEGVGANVDYSATMFEVFKYFGGYTSPAHAQDGVAGVPVDRSHFGPLRYSGNPDGRDDSAAFDPSSQRTTYLPPLSPTSSCAKNYVIFIGNGFPTQDADPSLLSGVGGTTSQLAMPQFSTFTTTPTTDLGTDAVCETNAQCAARAATTFPGYDTYTCTGGTQSSVQTATDNVCESNAACVSRAQTTFPGFASYSCSGGTSGGGVTTGLGNYAVCSTSAECTTQATTVGTAGGFVAPFSCTGGSSSGISNPFGGGTTSGTTCETAAACGTRMTGLLPGGSGLTATCSGGNAPACSGAARNEFTVTYSCSAAGTSFNRTMQGTTAGCVAPDLTGQTMAATPATVCTGSNFLNQTMQGTKTLITVTPTGTSAVPASSVVRYADEWAKYLYTTDVGAAPGQQNVTTYAIDVFKDAQDARQTSLLFSMAKYGGGKYFQATSEQAILDALRQILIEIQSVNTVFAAASLPINATNRTQNENQVFIGMFRPDANARPRWYGNLKRYQIAKIDGETKLADADLKDALSATTGFIQPCARSFWTSDSGTYWNFSAGSAGTCTSATTDAFSDTPDGPVVEKGATAEVVRKGNNPPTTDATPTFSVSRSMNTCSNTSSTVSCNIGTTMHAFNTTNVDQAAVGAADATEQQQIVDFTRGVDVNDDNANTSNVDTRPSIHGDIVHSRPLPVNYGGTTGVVVYYGSNDGTFRAVRASDGKELWAFVAPEHHAKLKRLRHNSPQILYPNMTAPFPSPMPTKKEYFFDGSIGLFQNLDNSKIWIFPSMRRGGRMVYGFDVTSSTTPLMKWSAGCPNLANDTGCTSGLTNIGQTWSIPSVAKIKGYHLNNPVVIMGGGYDACDDADISTPTCTSPKGSNVYVLDGDAGTLVKNFGTGGTGAITRSVPSDIALVDRDFDGYVDHAYFADTGGNLYRIDFVNPATLAPLASSAWTVTKIAFTNGSGRKFVFPPALFSSTDKVFLTMASGDRERPLVTNYPWVEDVKNRAYMFIDKFAGSAVNLDGTSMDNFTTDTGCSAVLSANSDGWFFDLTNGRGEQGVTSTAIVGGLVLFSTNMPDTSPTAACSNNLGRAFGYAVNLLNASGAVGTQAVCGGPSRSGEFIGGGLPPSPVTGTVPVGGKMEDVVIGGINRQSPSGGTGPIGAQQFKPAVAQKRHRVYWYRGGDK